MYYSLYRRKHIIHRTKKERKLEKYLSLKESRYDNKRNKTIHIIGEQLVQFVVESEVGLDVVAAVVVDLDY